MCDIQDLISEDERWLTALLEELSGDNAKLPELLDKLISEDERWLTALLEELGRDNARLPELAVFPVFRGCKKGSSGAPQRA